MTVSNVLKDERCTRNPLKETSSMASGRASRDLVASRSTVEVSSRYRRMQMMDYRRITCQTSKLKSPSFEPSLEIRCRSFHRKPYTKSGTLLDKKMSSKNILPPADLVSSNVEHSCFSRVGVSNRSLIIKFLGHDWRWAIPARRPTSRLSEWRILQFMCRIFI